MPKQEVRIVNPVPGGQNRTSVERARRFVRHGRAVMVGPLVLQFLDTPLQRFIAADAQEKLLAQNTGYDRTDRTFYDSARQIPIINASKMIREERSSRQWSFSASVHNRERQNEANNANPDGLAVFGLRSAIARGALRWGII